ncbi:MAG: BolA family protein [Gammaproteobacteria bacterium]
MQSEEIKQLIENGLADCEARVSGDGSHFEAVVISPAFAGKSLVEQHRMVYATLGGRMEAEEIHALSIRPYTPAAWARARKLQGA